MKKTYLKSLTILVLLITALPFISFSQKNNKAADTLLTLPYKNDQIFYEEIGTAPGTKKAIFKIARKWFVDNFNDAKSVLQIEDKEDGILTGKALYRYNFNSGVNSSKVALFFTLHVEMKDGKYRIRFYDMNGINEKTNGLLAGLSALSGNYDDSASTSIIDIDYTKSYEDYINGKKVKYNRRLLDGMNQQVLGLFASFKKSLNAESDDF